MLNILQLGGWVIGEYSEATILVKQQTATVKCFLWNCKNVKYENKPGSYFCYFAHTNATNALPKHSYTEDFKLRPPEIFLLYMLPD